ncbi:hypothetical protein HQ47_04080 [Porphyromonas macacae]|uniref:Uncharacterized protein n=1 Tax=Porphyromonas macacae TaxID=28115 RepID=A0A0A2E883_9PORP|nr:hypothetical protein [Porphyromonas macacae]KGN75091.1 hypothetical protein HQ47_04080 [Porphyromonas macacae]
MEAGKEYIYQTDIIGKTKVHSTESDYKIGIRNKVVYKGRDKETDLYRFEITELSYDLEQYEDPLIVQITEMTNKVCSIYKILDIGVDKNGNITKIFNRDFIREEWAKVKEWLLNAHPLEAYDIIRAKEFELLDEEKEIRSIRYIYFLYQYFYIFGKRPTNDSKNYLQEEEMDRFGSGVIIPVSFSLAEEMESDNNVWHLDGRMIRHEDAIRRLREFSKDQYMHPEYKLKAKYIYNNLVLLHSDFTLTEELGEFFYYHCFMSTHLETEQENA